MAKDDYDMVRVTVRVRKSTLEAIDKYILAIGAYRTYFLGMALVLGSRSLMEKFGDAPPGGRVSVPEAGSRSRVAEMVQHETLGGSPAPQVADRRPGRRSGGRFADLEAQLVEAGLTAPAGDVDSEVGVGEVEVHLLETGVDRRLRDWDVVEGEFVEKEVGDEGA